MTTAIDDPITHFATIDALEAFLGATAGVQSEAPGLQELDHSLQCAAELEVLAPDDLELQIAGLVHDVGHGLGHISVHAEVGAEAVRGLLGDRVAGLIALHVDAKRYLVATDETYVAKLSPVSVATLRLQGGGMDAAEIATFEANPLAHGAVLLRRADEAAKVPGRAVPGLDHWLPALRKVAAAQSR